MVWRMGGVSEPGNSYGNPESINQYPASLELAVLSDMGSAETNIAALLMVYMRRKKV